jgi:tRNA(Ile)-lysidine synthase
VIDSSLQNAIQCVPPGAWAVGVSGGADSVTLLSLLRLRGDLSLRVVHLDHQTRGDASTGDARFVEQLAARWQLPCTLARRDEIEPTLHNPPANRSALYRAVRLALFRRVVREHSMSGVVLAHHSDDQAETIFQRLLRGSGYAGLAGMSPCTDMNGLTILRPMLSVTRAAVREHLQKQKIAWREDASNDSDQYLRNRLRRVLAESPELTKALLGLGQSCAALKVWVSSVAPTLDVQLRTEELARLPRIVADESARRWLTLSAGVPPQEITPAMIERLHTMATDAASPARQDFPAGATLRRRRGILSAHREGTPA